MAATTEKGVEVAKQVNHGPVNLLRTVRAELLCRAMKHVSEGGAASNNLMTSHTSLYLAGEAIKEVLDFLRSMSKHNEK
jgi:hypothetical protein